VPAGDYTWRVSISGATPRKSDARAFRVDAGAFVAHPQVASARGSEAASAPVAAPVFELQSAESWVPFARTAVVPHRPTGGFFGGFTE
jgi:hypothetical protein